MANPADPNVRRGGYRLALAGRVGLAAGGATGDGLADVVHRLVRADIGEDVEVVRVGR